MIKYATIGTGWITESFIMGCELLNGKMQLEAVYSRTAENGSAFASKFGCKKVYTCLDELAKDQNIDAVYIASPNALHYSQSKQLLLSGKHVICEKPITVTENELSELQSLAKEKGLIYMEALMAMHLPYRQKVKEAIKTLGKISHARLDFSQRSSKYDSFKKGEHQNIFDPKMATGALMDLGVYCLYAAIDLFGEPESVVSWCDKLITGVDGNGGAMLKYSDFQINITYSKTGQSIIGSEIVGDNGTLVMPSISKLCDAYIIYSDGQRTELTDSLEKHELMSYEALDFYKYITDFETYKEQYYCDCNTSIKVSKLITEIRKQQGLSFKSI